MSHNHSKQVAKITVFITSIFVIFLSVTYAFINVTLSGTKRQVITAGDLSLVLEEDENNLTIENALPMYDEVGMIQDAFTFRLVNNGTRNVGYRVKLIDITTGENKLSTSDVKYYLTKDGNGEPELLSSLESDVIDFGTIGHGQTIHYTLRLWIADSVTDNNTISGKSLSYRIDVEALSVELDENGCEVLPETEPNTPVLANGMIPVTYDTEEKNWKRADTTSAWYDYDAQMWANAVTMDQTKVLDLSGKNNNGEIVGATMDSTSASFDGVNDYINCGLANYDFQDQFSAVVRFKANSANFNLPSYILGNAESAGMLLHLVHDGSAIRIHYAIRNGVDYQRKNSNTIIEIGKWYEVAMVFDGDKIDLYINGVLDSSLSLESHTNMIVSRAPLLLAANPGVDESGNLVDISELGNITVTKTQIYDRSLSKEEVETIYNNETLETKDGLLVSYDFRRGEEILSDTPINMDMINTMWVWIPRYSYTIRDTYGVQLAGGSTPTKETPGAIDVKFIPASQKDTGSGTSTKCADNWVTPEGFTFGAEELSGFWVGKFETTGSMSAACTDENCTTADITIKPNLTSLRNQTVSSFFYGIRSMQNTTNAKKYGFDVAGSGTTDIHMAKNTEWGIVAYLFQSKYGKYGNPSYSGADKEVTINNCSNYITGIGGDSVAEEASATSCTTNTYETEKGRSASTTGTIYGVYDMSGGAYEYVMGNYNNTASSSGFASFPDNKYYDLYTSEDISMGYKFGDATYETKDWYHGYAHFVASSSPWFHRGDYYGNAAAAGIFVSNNYNGSADTGCGARAILKP